MFFVISKTISKHTFSLLDGINESASLQKMENITSRLQHFHTPKCSLARKSENSNTPLSARKTFMPVTETTKDQEGNKVHKNSRCSFSRQSRSDTVMPNLSIRLEKPSQHLFQTSSRECNQV